MRFTTVLPLALVALTEAATLHGCAGKCIGEAIASTQCSSADSNCICSSESFLSSINECVPLTCNVDEQDAAITFAQEFCHKIELAKRGVETSAAAPVEKRSSSSWSSMWSWMKRSPEAAEGQFKSWPWHRNAPRAPPNKHKAAPVHVPWFKRGAWASTISGYNTVATVQTVQTVGTVYGGYAHWPPAGGPAKWGVGR